MQPSSSKRLAVLITVLVTAVFAVIFAIVFANASVTPSGTPVVLSEETYVTEVNALLENANPANAEALLTQYQCVACHRIGAENGGAPSFVGLSQIAVERRPPLSAAAYIYESITNPGVYIVEGFANAMPADYDSRISDQELGDIIAYLLSEDAH